MQWKSGINQASQKESNLSLVIRAIHGDPQCSRVRLSEQTGLKQATITKIINQLLNWGLVSEVEYCDEGACSVGRKPIRLTLNSENYLLMAVRINRDYLRVAIYDIMCNLCDFREVRIDVLEGVDVSMNQLKRMMHQAAQSVSKPIMGIGVALPGPFDSRHNRITLMSGFPGWEKIDIKQTFEDEFHIPVFLDHDARCGALAELWHGEHRFTGNLLYICCDRGVGAGLIVNGEIYRGSTGFAGEIGHTSINLYGPICECGNHGCLELYCSTGALEQEYRSATFDILNPANEQFGLATAQEILQLVRQGDSVAQKVYQKVTSYLAFGVVNVVNTLSPDVVIFADKMIEGGELFIQTVRATMKKFLLPAVYDHLIIDVATLGCKDPMLLGASVLVFEALLNQPSISFGNPQAADEGE
ncbi:MAG: ROK family protein [Clostridia bacterium]